MYCTVKATKGISNTESNQYNNNHFVFFKYKKLPVLPTQDLPRTATENLAPPLVTNGFLLLLVIDGEETNIAFIL